MLRRANFRVNVESCLPRERLRQNEEIAAYSVQIALSAALT